MYEKLQGIVLRTVRYNDKNSVVRVYTDRYGMLSFLLPQNNGRTARMRRAQFMPLSLVEIVADITGKRDIYSLRETRALVSLPSLMSDPVKNAVALFITELLSHVIVEQESNGPLFAFICRSVCALDAAERGASNFHICFLWNLGRYLGVEPDMSTYEPGAYFDLQEGCFRISRPLAGEYLGPDDSAVLYQISRMNYANMHVFKFSRGDRQRMVGLTLKYFRLHHSSVGLLRSLDVLADLFD